MTALRERLLQRQTLLVAAALLLPIPLFAQSGLSVPLPGVVERGLGSLVTLEANDERSGTKATGNAAENGRESRRSGRGSLRIVRGGGIPTVLESGSPSGTGNRDPAASDKPAGDGGGGGTAPAGSDPDGAGAGDDAGSPGDPAPTDPGSSGDASGETGSTAGPTLGVTAAGQGASNGVSAGAGGLGVDLGADNGDTADGSSGAAGVQVTNEDGSQTGVGTAVPGVGVPVP